MRRLGRPQAAVVSAARRSAGEKDRASFSLQLLPDIRSRERLMATGRQSHAGRLNVYVPLRGRGAIPRSTPSLSRTMEPALGLWTPDNGLCLITRCSGNRSCPVHYRPVTHLALPVCREKERPCPSSVRGAVLSCFIVSCEKPEVPQHALGTATAVGEECLVVRVIPRHGDRRVQHRKAVHLAGHVRSSSPASRYSPRPAGRQEPGMMRRRASDVC